MLSSSAPHKRRAAAEASSARPGRWTRVRRSIASAADSFGNRLGGGPSSADKAGSAHVPQGVRGVILVAAATSQQSNFDPMSAVYIVVGVVALAIWGWKNEKEERLAAERRREAEERRREAEERRRVAEAAELQRIQSLYPTVSAERLHAHHRWIVEQQARAAKQAELQELVALGLSARELRLVAIERGDATINRRAVLQRSGWRCGICGKGIKRSFAWNKDDDRCGTIDHIVPVSRGGVHEWWNVQAAHWGCNKAKRAS